MIVSLLGIELFEYSRYFVQFVRCSFNLTKGKNM